MGYGDIAARVATAMQPHPCISLSRRPAPPPVKSHIADLDQADSLPVIDGRVLYTAPPARDGEDDTRLAACLDRCRDIEVFVYISTSGVYGDCAGAWVDENHPPAPITARARRRLAAETRLRGWAEARGLRWVILRVPGIYGPGRLPRDRLEKGLPILDPREAPWSNRIHADDLTSVCMLALDKGQGIYNVSDGHPGAMSEYFLACARHLGLPTPPLVDMATAARTFSPQLMSFYRESRRLDIDKARRELGFTPRYPDLASGLAAC